MSGFRIGVLDSSLGGARLSGPGQAEGSLGLQVRHGQRKASGSRLDGFLATNDMRVIMTGMGAAGRWCMIVKT